MDPDVRCHVESCVHWLPGKKCGAGAIDVLGGDSEAARQTECQTFSFRSSLSNIVSALDNANFDGLFSGSGDFSPSVTCTVDACRYWDEGNKCGAPAIEVRGARPRASSGTDCATFAPR